MVVQINTMYKELERTRIMNLFENNRREKFSFTDDMVFHYVFGQDTEKSKKALIALLNTVIEEDTPIKEIKILNPIDYRKREEYKKNGVASICVNRLKELLRQKVHRIVEDKPAMNRLPI